MLLRDGRSWLFMVFDAGLKFYLGPRLKKLKKGKCR